VSAQIISDIAIALPFSISAYGKVSSTTSQDKIWADRIRSAVGTALNERIMRPGYGTSIPYELFNNQDDVTAKIKSEVSRVFGSQLSPVTLLSTDVTYDKYTNTSTVEIVYSTPNRNTNSVSIGFAAISGNNQIIQETL
jgi:phage baseplate assembly protein W